MKLTMHGYTVEVAEEEFSAFDSRVDFMEEYAEQIEEEIPLENE